MCVITTVTKILCVQKPNEIPNKIFRIVIKPYNICHTGGLYYHSFRVPYETIQVTATHLEVNFYRQLTSNDSRWLEWNDRLSGLNTRQLAIYSDIRLGLCLFHVQFLLFVSSPFSLIICHPGNIIYNPKFVVSHIYNVLSILYGCYSQDIHNKHPKGRSLRVQTATITHSMYSRYHTDVIPKIFAMDTP